MKIISRKEGLANQPRINAAGMRMVKLLVGQQPRTVAELIRETEVTRTAVTEQLGELVAAGFVERTVDRAPGRGRPRHLYGATTVAMLLLFPSNQQIVVPAIWRAIAQIGGRPLTERVLGRVSHALAEHYKSRIKGTTPQQRLRALIDVLADEGVLVEIEDDGHNHLILCKRSCPFISMYEETGVVCRVDRQVLSEVVGAEVVRTASRLEGAACCMFELAGTNRSAPRRDTN